MDTVSPTQQTNPEIDPSEEQTVKLWRKRIKDAKVYFEPDYKRIRENMEFAANIQWEGQESADDKEGRYIANFITHHINQKVASLYARDPKAVAECRKRLNFQLWDGTVEQEWQAAQATQMAGTMGMETPSSVMAQQLLADIAQGKQFEQICDRVGKTLEILYGYQCDTQSPSFKFQMKQLVRRVVTCGVGYVRLNFVQSFDHVLSSSMTDDSLAYRLKRVRAIMDGVQDDKIQDDDPRIEQLKLLLESVQSSVQEGDMTNIEQRLEFDFPQACSIIVDPKCKCLKGFIGAEWIAQQYILPLDVANSYFELRGDKMVKTGGEFVQYADDATEVPRPTDSDKPQDLQKTPLGCFWEVFDLTTKSHFFVADGWKWYVQQPKPVEPSINRFWPIFALTFNDVEVEPGQKVHVYPPSDVQLLKPMQKERNRTRQELREHRQVNRPFFYGLKQSFSETDLEKFANHKTGEFIQLESPAMDINGKQNVEGSIGKWTGTPIDQSVYTTTPLDEDASLAVGSNQVQQGMPIRHVAATPAVLQEQSRMSGVNSNVDDLDDMLSELAEASGEMMLRTFTPDTVKRIVGRGAVWPDQNREDFLNSVYLTIVASSSGRPNKAVEIANFERIAPTLLQTGANPIAVVEEAVKRLDDRLDASKFYPPQQPQQMMPMLGQQQQKQPPPNQATGLPPMSAQPMAGVVK